MRLSSGFLRSLAGTKWSVELSSLSVTYSIENGGKQKLPILSVTEISQFEGTLSYGLRIKTTSQSLEFKGISAQNCAAFIEKTKHHIASQIGVEFRQSEQQVKQLAHAFTLLQSQNFYLNQSKIAELIHALPDNIRRLLTHAYFDASHIPVQFQGFATSFLALCDPHSQDAQQRNADYVRRQLTKYEPIFDTIEAHPLTLEQREAVVTEEDNILLVAAAGSGKSSTLIAKIFYLLKEQQHQHDEVIAFAFNKDAQEELTARIESLYQKFNWQGPRVGARTFHGFCMDVITQVDDKKPSISPLATSRKQQLNFFNQLVESLKQTNADFNMALLQYYSLFKFPPPDETAIKDRIDYNQYLMKLDGKGARNEKTGEWEVTLTSMSGVDVKSLEELRIANWLYLNGINFEYEKRYSYDTADSSYRQYYPDFYYPDIDVWHEHFALDKNGKAPAFMNNYEGGVDWKRELHGEYNTQLVETYSANFKDGTALERLNNALTFYETPRTKPSVIDIDEMINRVFNPSRDLELIITFIKHMKTNNLSVEQINQNLPQYADPQRAKSFMQVLTPIYHAYQAHLTNNGEIDFEDLVHKACEHIESKRYQSPYTYIMVDEYQDASQDRIRLIKGLLAQHSQAKLFAVGDDWQSIYRFAGADLKVMTGFEDIFGFTKQLQLTNTFRCAQQIADVAATMVQKNPEQFTKTVKSIHRSPKPPVILRPYSPQNPDTILYDIVKALQNRAQQANTKVTVYILTRYIQQKPRNLVALSSHFPNVHVDWKTVHASKGLEADYVIIHHLNGGRLGFPSEMVDDPLLHLVIPKGEQFPNAEERRLLYVALTRAKQAVFCFYHPDNPSTFIKELSSIDGVKTNDPRYAPTVTLGDQCPKCQAGKIQTKVGKNGLFLGCSAYPDCSYTTTMRCPACKVGNIVTRKAKKTGRQFQACDQFPTCKHIHKLNKHC